jgi:uncharacterized membrane protein YqjE
MLLLYFVMPVWFLAGLADYLCHRASDIEHTAGAKESLIHLLMFAEVAVPLLACLFLEINALVIATTTYVLAVLGAALFLEVLPYLEELWRGLRARLNMRKRQRAPAP